MRPRIVDKLGSPVSPMGGEGIFFVFFGSLGLAGPESAPLIPGRPAARRNFVKALKAAVAFWRVVRGSRAVFDREWFSRMGVFPNGLKRSCVRTSHETSPLLCATGAPRAITVSVRQQRTTLCQPGPLAWAATWEMPLPSVPQSPWRLLSSESGVRLRPPNRPWVTLEWPRRRQGAQRVSLEESDQFGLGQLSHLFRGQVLGGGVARPTPYWLAAASIAGRSAP